MVTLEKELATFAANLPSLQKDSGRFALIKGDEVSGIFDTYGDALTIGYEKYGLTPFLVKKIAPAEQIHQFSRNLKAVCL